MSRRHSNGSMCEQYRKSLERRIEQGDSDLMCQDKELCKAMEETLRKGDTRDFYTALGLDPLAVMEASLKASPSWGRHEGGLMPPTTAPCLGALSRAFEVLERVALNFYLYPWRKEYRVIKMFSGVFTHLVRPVLSEQQVGLLFGLLGYQAKGEELQTSGPLPSGTTLLRIACAFFAVRCECRLLLSAAETLGGGVDVQLQLVQERQKGHSLQRALENLRGKIETENWGSRDDPELDLYTAGDHASNGETEGLSTGKSSKVPNYSMKMSLSISSNHLATRDSSVSAQTESRYSTAEKDQVNVASSLGSNSYASMGHPKGGAAKLPESQPSGDGWMGMTQGQNLPCHCLSNTSLYTYKCLENCGIHDVNCHIYERCEKKGHESKLIDVSTMSWAKGGRASVKELEKPSYKEALRTQTEDVELCCLQEPYYRCNSCRTLYCLKCCLEKSGMSCRCGGFFVHVSPPSTSV
ncbi:hypothetical protein AGOR_G00169340 [Albula goreensis]|uniref:Spermatogenesis-associated protein 2 PUB-like domain-containing protein n=1 Tax=Albula goreensis TaxID=1534307 RepID=A0A8T3D0Q1_9TELE|nr:hypothetical protein AGOR_G00169340 [Albula goreensis]